MNRRPRSLLAEIRRQQAALETCQVKLTILVNEAEIAKGESFPRYSATLTATKDTMKSAGVTLQKVRAELTAAADTLATLVPEKAGA